MTTSAQGVGNFVLKGYPIANGIVSSIRCDESDGPDFLWAVGYKVSDIFGPLGANLFCNLGYIFVKRTASMYVLLFLLFVAFIWLMTPISTAVLLLE